MAPPRVALVIPAWNEAASIGAVLAEIPPGIAEWTFVVSGNSSDGTPEIAVAHGAQALPQKTPGYGAACWAGARAARAAGAEVVVFLDGDYSDPPGELLRVLAPILAGEADLVLGCRRAAVPWHARVGNRLVLTLLHVLLGYRLADLPSLKAIKLANLDRLDMQEMTYGWTVEMIYKAVRADLRIAEVAVTYRARLGGRSKVSGTVRGSAGAAWKLITSAVRHARWSPREAAGELPLQKSAPGLDCGEEAGAVPRASRDG